VHILLWAERFTPIYGATHDLQIKPFNRHSSQNLPRLQSYTVQTEAQVKMIQQPLSIRSRILLIKVRVDLKLDIV